jgi:hypothetical protein
MGLQVLSAYAMDDDAMSRLQHIKGTVNELQVAKGYEDFVFSSDGKAAVGVAAVGAAAMGQLFNSTVLLSASGGAEMSMEYFTCMLDGQRVAGRFHRIGFANGEEVEFVGSQSGDAFAAVAARSPQRRMIWALPHHERGEIAQKRQGRKWSWVLSVIASVGGALAVTPLNGTESLLEVFIMFMVLLPIFLLICVFVRSFVSRYGEAATPIFEALGFEKPAQTDLPKIDREARKKIKQTADKSTAFSDLWTYRY